MASSVRDPSGAVGAIREGQDSSPRHANAPRGSLLVAPFSVTATIGFVAPVLTRGYRHVISTSYSIDEIAVLLARLRRRDRGFRVFGSWGHRYRLREPLTERRVADFECEVGVSLPADYREFLRSVGDGPAGPYYGLERLPSDAHHLARPFPLKTSTEGALMAEWDWRREDEDEFPGLLELCHQGCAYYSYLVVNGESRGTIWVGGELFFYPTGLCFSQWYGSWASRALHVLSNEHLVALLTPGMTTEQVLETVDGDWKLRPVHGRASCYLEAWDIPAQLVLDERGVVTEVRSFSSISAHPR